MGERKTVRTNKDSNSLIIKQHYILALLLQKTTQTHTREPREPDVTQKP